MLGIIYESLSTPRPLGVLLVVSVLLAIIRIVKIFTQAQGKRPNKDQRIGYEIEPLLDFDFRKVDPIKYQPYKTQGHVTMGKQGILLPT